MGNEATNRRKLSRLRKRLIEEGVSEAKIARILAAKRAELDARARAELAVEAAREAIIDETWARLTPDDSKSKPSAPDPLLVGAGRVTGITAKAVRRGRALTKFEYDQLEAASDG